MRIAHISSRGVPQFLDEHLNCVAGFCAGWAEAVGMGAFATLCGLLHDMGKCSDQFESYLRYSHSHPGDKSLHGRVVHSTQGAKFIMEYSSKGKIVERQTAALIGLLIAGHHGGLMDFVSPYGDQPYLERLKKDDPELCYEQILSEFSAESSTWPKIDDLFTKAVEEFTLFAKQCKEKRISTQFTVHLMARLLFSCLIDADHLDAYRFEAGLAPEALKEPIPPWEELSSRLEFHLTSLDADSPINQLRKQISDQCRDAAARLCGIYELNVPTGGGKTLASLRFALEHAQHNGKKHVIYVIPYTTIIDQNALEIRSILQRDDLILEHHSSVIDDALHKPEEENSAATLLTERWNSPIILTTMVQFLNTLYSGGTRAVRRMHSLIDSVLIFDEIQSAPMNCIHLLTSGMNFLNRICGSSILLCTATQPRLSGVARPLMMTENSHIVGGMDAAFRTLRRTRIVDVCVDGGYSVTRLYDLMAEKMDGLSTGLAILNTRHDAHRFFGEVEHRNKYLPEELRFHTFFLSTDLCPMHRKVILKEIRELLPHGRVLLVSTQLVEAGVDVSFQCVFRALAGLDSIAQAAGRCNRHAEHHCRDVFIFNIAGENLQRLPDIKCAQESAWRILLEVRIDPSAYNGDLLSNEAIDKYFEYYYGCQENAIRMDYPVPAISSNATMYDLLGNNKIGTCVLTSRGGMSPILPQAFAAAGEHFHAIDDSATAVIVPYGEGTSLIELLRNDHLPLKDRAAILHRAQQVSVNIFSYILSQLEQKRAIEVLPGGVLALAGRYYHKTLGVTPEGAEMETLFA